MAVSGLPIVSSTICFKIKGSTKFEIGRVRTFDLFSTFYSQFVQTAIGSWRISSMKGSEYRYTTHCCPSRVNKSSGF
jgi:hypothetical protein